ncbi:unnamed protein product [Gongylonema pulchrum]|uniref:Uncharacterized protein n=1 Tax=Gongylonema pulchrum TaxID=637853 RepID=A0A3P7RXA7_9BILA|nr:unnamed protein product [Gongylonema pulchrum]
MLPIMASIGSCNHDLYVKRLERFRQQSNLPMVSSMQPRTTATDFSTLTVVTGDGSKDLILKLM